MIFGILKGLITTAKHFFRKKITLKYPEEKLAISDNYRGKPIFDINKCIGCYLCQMKCPDTKNIISIKTKKDEQTQKNIILDYQINLGRCCYCGICSEVCPTSAIIMGKEYEMVAYDKNDLLLNLVSRD